MQKKGWVTFTPDLMGNTWLVAFNTKIISTFLNQYTSWLIHYICFYERLIEQFDKWGCTTFSMHYVHYVRYFNIIYSKLNPFISEDAKLQTQIPFFSSTWYLCNVWIIYIFTIHITFFFLDMLQILWRSLQQVRLPKNLNKHKSTD